MNQQSTAAKQTGEAIVGLVTISDRASRGVYQDRGIPALMEWLERALSTPWRAVTRVIPDERPLIEATLAELVDRDGCCLVLTTGGTGPAPRDVTPDATLAVADRVLDGLCWTRDAQFDARAERLVPRDGAFAAPELLHGERYRAALRELHRVL